MVTSIYLVIMAAFGTVHSALAILALPVGVLTGLAFAAPIAAFAAAQQNDTGFSTIYRFGLIPLFLFSGTFFPIAQLPGWLQPVAQATPLYHGVALCRGLVLGHVRPGRGRGASRLSGRTDGRGVRARHRHVPPEARDMTDVSHSTDVPHRGESACGSRPWRCWARAGPGASSSATSSCTGARGCSSCRGSSSPSSTCCPSVWG